MYKTSSQLKREAKDSLRGRWKEALVLNLIPSLVQVLLMFLITLMVGVMLVAVSYLVTADDSQVESSSGITETIREDILSEIDSDDDSPFGEMTVLFPTYGVAPLINIVISFLTIGISFTFLDVIRKRQDQSMEVKDAFKIFNGVDFIPIFLINLLMYVFKLLWSFVFVIPAMVKHYSYSQSNFIYKDISDNRDVRSMSATSFITESRNLMKGHKGRLFWIDLSFIGWYFVGMLTFGIGMLWINPYINATKAAFYNDLAKDSFLTTNIDTVIEDGEEWTSF